MNITAVKNVSTSDTTLPPAATITPTSVVIMEPCCQHARSCPPRRVANFVGA